MKIAIFTGPSGGHFFPAVAFVESFRASRPGARILLVTGKRGAGLVKGVKNQIQAEFDFLPDFPFPGIRGRDFLLRWTPFLVRLGVAFLKTVFLLLRFRPDLTLGFGSYTSFPGILVSRFLGIPCLIHEQNQQAGKANVWLARAAQGIAVSFEETEKLKGNGKIFWTGLPLRRTLVKRAAQKSPVKTGGSGARKLKILVLGGSQGSRFLNRFVLKTLAEIPPEEKEKIAVIHITGTQCYEWINKQYQKTGIEAEVIAFCESMEACYADADLAIARAGANTLFELALFGVPSIVIPYLHADAHQVQNARFFERHGAVVYFSETDAAPQRLKDEILDLTGSEKKRSRLSENMKSLSGPDAGDRLAEWADKHLGGVS